MEKKLIDWDSCSIKASYENGASIEFECKDEGVTYVAELSDEVCDELLDSIEYAAERYSEIEGTKPAKRRGWRMRKN